MKVSKVGLIRKRRQVRFHYEGEASQSYYAGEASLSSLKRGGQSSSWRGGKSVFIMKYGGHFFCGRLIMWRLIVKSKLNDKNLFIENFFFLM